jgi:predicted O-linked N-acetylglucosamine transferase (SPINDLY family)
MKRKTVKDNSSIQFHFQQALELHQRGDIAKAQELYQNILNIFPSHFDCLHMLGVCALQMGNFELGIRSIKRAVLVKPYEASAYRNLGNAFQELKQWDEALICFDKVLSIQPVDPEAFLNRGNVLLQLQRAEEALESYQGMLKLVPTDPIAHNNAGIALTDLFRLEEALEHFERAIEVKPDYAQAYLNRGNALKDLQNYSAALDSYNKAIALDHAIPEAYNNRGNVLKELRQLDGALACYKQALKLNPAYPEALNNLGTTLLLLGRTIEASASYTKALSIYPDYPFLIGNSLHVKLQLCEWAGIKLGRSMVDRGIRDAQKVCRPFISLSLFDDPVLQRTCAEIQTKSIHPQRKTRGTFPPPSPRDLIRIGYYSADFHNHATAYLMAELFETHDPNRFELYGFSFGPATNDDMARRVSAAFHQFVDVRQQGDREVAQLSRQMGIDIAVDLKGYTKDSRPGLFVAGCAPIQVSYLGYPGTLGAEFMDYIVADKMVIPVEEQRFYSEKVVYLPNSYQVNDSKRKIADKVFTRAELSLPEAGFVFCCFNNSYKILPEVFESWLRIATAVEGSVLWLLESNQWVPENLRKEAEARGFDARRLVFANHLPLAEHLARHRAADLFLDAFPYNAHTTASDALWSGLPVLTRSGRSFASRVGASLLTAVGLPELITTTIDDYERKAIELACNPAVLSALKTKLNHNRLTMPLFNGKLFAKHLEAAYEAMFDRFQAGLKPDVIEVTASTST